MPSPVKTTTRFPGFAFSAMLHCIMAAFLVLLESEHLPFDLIEDPAQPPVRYSLQLIHLSVPRYETGSETRESPVFRRFFNNPTGENSPNADKRPQRSTAESRQFGGLVMPGFVKPQPVQQTLVRPDVPPAIELKQEVPLPDLSGLRSAACREHSKTVRHASKASGSKNSARDAGSRARSARRRAGGQ